MRTVGDAGPYAVPPIESVGAIDDRPYVYPRTTLSLRGSGATVAISGNCIPVPTSHGTDKSVPYGSPQGANALRDDMPFKNCPMRPVGDAGPYAAPSIESVGAIIDRPLGSAYSGGS